MAKLTTCKTCNGQMSSQAEVCPHCNHPHEKERKEKSSMTQSVFWVAALILFFILLKYGIIDQILESILKN